MDLVRHERILVLCCIIVSLLGIALLIVVTDKQLEVKEDEVTHTDLGEVVSVSGVVNNLYETPKVVIFSLQYTDFSIKVVAFRSEKQSIVLRNGDKITVIGKVEEYEKEIEIIAEKILK